MIRGAMAGQFEMFLIAVEPGAGTRLEWSPAV
jgi:hypothetical protein